MPARLKRQIIAMGGAALPLELDNLLLVEYFLAQTGKRNPRVCFIGAAHGDADEKRQRHMPQQPSLAQGLTDFRNAGFENGACDHGDGVSE